MLLGRWVQRVVAVALVGLIGCARPELQQRCRLVTQHVVPPAMPADFRQLDLLLLGRAVNAAKIAESLKSPLTRSYQKAFAEDVLPYLCDRMELARQFAASGHIREAGREYQALLGASQLLQLELAVMQVAEYADAAGQPRIQIVQVLSAYAGDAQGAWDALLGPQGIADSGPIDRYAGFYAGWVAHLEQWIGKLGRGEERVEIAKLLWDTLMISVAAVQLTAGLAQVAAAAIRPPGAIGSLAGSGAGAVAMAVDRAAVAAAIEALKKLIASGALDSAVVGAIGVIGSATGPAATPSFEMARTTPSKLGGAYKDVVGPGGEAHHCPADSASSLSTSEGPALRMVPADHLQTDSYGNRIASRAFRARQRVLIEQGKFREAQQMDIDDIRSRFGSKYDEGIKQMLEYTDTIPTWKLRPKGAGR